MATEKLRFGRQFREVEIPAVVGQPLMVSYGMGTDSTAMLIWLYYQGIRPDVILFADTGDEKAWTNAYIDIMNGWLEAHDFPQITVVKKDSKQYHSLSANCLANRTLPSLAYQLKGCSQKWKVEVMNVWTNSWEPAVLAWHRGMKIVKLIGYDAGAADMKRSKIREDDKYLYVYPMRDNGIQRDECVDIISDEGLPLPGKSACTMCPASKRHEIVKLYHTEPHKAAEALRIEAVAEARCQEDRTPGTDGWYRILNLAIAKVAKKEFGDIKWTTEQLKAAEALVDLDELRKYRVVGLGSNWAWRDFLQVNYPAFLADLEDRFDTEKELAEAVRLRRKEFMDNDPTPPSIFDEVEDENESAHNAAATIDQAAIGDEVTVDVETTVRLRVVDYDGERYQGMTDDGKTLEFTDEDITTIHASPENFCNERLVHYDDGDAGTI